jgi:hypothetical protein
VTASDRDLARGMRVCVGQEQVRPGEIGDGPASQCGSFIRP